MEPDLRSRHGALGDRTLTRLLAALLATACSERAPEPRTVDVAALPAADVPAAVVAECHAPLRGRMDRVEATVTTEAGATTRVFAALPGRLRAQDERGQFLLLGDDVLRLEQGQARAAEPADRQRVLALRRLVDAAALGPLHRATGCQRLGPHAFTVQGQDRATRVELRADALLPTAFGDGDERVVIDDWQRTSATWLVARASTNGLARCSVRFELGDITWAPDVFTPPAERAGAKHQQITDPGVVVERQSPTPQLVEGKELGLVLVEDPGDWASRAAAYAPLHDELVRQDQIVAGFPMLWQDDGGRWLAAPFRRRADGPALQPPNGWRTRTVAAGRWLVVHPPAGTLAERIARGSEQLREALRERGLTARGPITAQPYLHLEEGVPEPAAAAAPKVRVAIAVQ